MSRGKIIKLTSEAGEYDGYPCVDIDVVIENEGKRHRWQLQIGESEIRDLASEYQYADYGFGPVPEYVEEEDCSDTTASVALFGDSEGDDEHVIVTIDRGYSEGGTMAAIKMNLLSVMHAKQPLCGEIRRTMGSPRDATGSYVEAARHSGTTLPSKSERDRYVKFERGE